MAKTDQIGSKWWKMDFHSHTPASNDWRDDTNTTASEWLKAAMTKEIDCIAITDHNSGDWVDKLKSEYEKLSISPEKPEWFRELFIFPGIEISVGESIRRTHLLAIFDPKVNKNKIVAMLGRCGIDNDFGDHERKTTQSNLTETIKYIKESGGIAIPAHVERDKGLLNNITTPNPEIENSLSKIDTIELCDLNWPSSIHEELQNKIKGKSIVQGSDAHKLESIGEKFSWIKMDKPTIDELRLALNDNEISVINQKEDPNTVPDIYVDSLVIRNMQHCGRPNLFEVTFHPLFNAIIGGRGTGKSTVLESIRIASGRVIDLKEETPRLHNDLENFMKQESDNGVMLENTSIHLRIVKNNNQKTFLWNHQTKETQSLRQEEDGSSEDRLDSSFKDRFPLSIYSQKQIVELAINPNGLLRIIDASTEIDSSSWESKHQQLLVKHAQLRLQLNDFDQKCQEMVDLKAELKEIEKDLERASESGETQILHDYQVRSVQGESILRPLDEEHYISRINSLIDDVPQVEYNLKDLNLAEQEYEELEKIENEYSSQLDNVRNKIKGIKEELRLAANNRQSAIQQSIWKKSYDLCITNYTKVSETSDLDLDKLRTWVDRSNSIKGQLRQEETVVNDRQSNQIEIEECLSQIKKHLLERASNRQKVLDSTIKDSKYVKMELISFGDTTTLEEDFRQILNLKLDSFEPSILDLENETGLLLPLFKENKNKSDLDKRLTELNLLKQAILELNFKRYSGINQKLVNNLANKFNSDSRYLEKIETWWPKDRLIVKYAKGKSFESLERGSAGQKAAAILAFILRNGQQPLIIDQPEDDLDGALIYDLIVNEINSTKTKRQLIIVTHNPNIVVNGDAELVHALDFKGGQIRRMCQGGLGDPEIREAVCNIMEGGKVAFEKRYQRLFMKSSQE